MIDQTERADYDRAATGYLVWPLAWLTLVREGSSASSWQRIHTRQAATYGVVVTVGFFVLMALPLFVVIAVPSISTEATVLVYGAGLVADLIALVAGILVTLAYAARASRGELFAIPLIAPLTDRIFRLRR